MLSFQSSKSNPEAANPIAENCKVLLHFTQNFIEFCYGMDLPTSNPEEMFHSNPGQKSCQQSWFVEYVLVVKAKTKSDHCGIIFTPEKHFNDRKLFVKSVI